MGSSSSSFSTCPSFNVDTVEARFAPPANDGVTDRKDERVAASPGPSLNADHIDGVADENPKDALFAAPPGTSAARGGASVRGGASALTLGAAAASARARAPLHAASATGAAGPKLGPVHSAVRCVEEPVEGNEFSIVLRSAAVPSSARLGSALSRLAGELYVCSTEDLAAVDELEEHPHHYRRDRVGLAGGGDAWMYVLVDEAELAAAERDPENYADVGDDWVAFTRTQANF